MSLVARSGAAQSLRVHPTHRVVLDYQATPGCPDRTRFVNGLQQLAPSLEVASASAANVPAIALSLEKHAAGYRGALRFESTERQVESEVCADTAYALALIAAITLDPDADVASDVSAEVFSEPAPTTSEPGKATGSEIAPQPLRRPAAPAHSETRSTEAVPKATASGTQHVVRVQGFVGRELLGVLGWGGSLGFSLLDERTAPVVLWVDLNALHTSRTFSGTSMQALALTVVPSACARVLGQLRPWALDVCLGVELGAVQVAAQDTASFRPTRAPWHVQGAGFLGIALLHRVAQAWRIGASLQAGVGFQRNSYTATDVAGEETTRIVESSFTQRLTLQAGYAF